VSFVRALAMLTIPASLVLLLLAPSAAADEALDACSAAAVTGQKLRRAAKLREAQSWFEVCARPACREDIVQDCRTWQDEVTRLLPAVSIHVREADGRPATDARVVIDGTLVPAEVLAQPVPLDPGPHTIDFERAGAPRLSRRVVLTEGQRVEISETMPSEAPSPLRSSSVTAATATPSRPIPTSAIVSGAVAAAGVLAFGTLAAIGYGDWRGSKCDVDCAHGDATRVRTTLLLADVSLAIGIVAGGLATFFYLDRPSTRQP
jgi:hypothetical protein